MVEVKHDSARKKGNNNVQGTVYRLGMPNWAGENSRVFFRLESRRGRCRVAESAARGRQ